MPEYTYACDSCGHKWSIFCHMSEYKAKKKCPSCKKIKSVHRDYEEDNVYGGYSYSLSEAKTLGHYADKQAKKSLMEESNGPKTSLLKRKEREKRNERIPNISK
jgi:putative FmdB family regulatory protein